MPRPLFHGWRVVGVCFTAAVFTWGFAVFGASVYLSELTRVHGWPISVVSAGVTLLYLTNALSLTAVGAALARFGSRPVFITGTLALCFGVAAIGQITAIWQVFPAFMLIGWGYACLSLTGISTTIAPWFNRHQGRSVAIALMGASFGAMVVVPLMVLAIGRFGFATTTLGGACLTAAVMIPLAARVLRHRAPAELGLGPDGDAPAPASARATGQRCAARWDRAAAIRTGALWTTAVGFAFGLTVQVGFLTHHVKLAEPVLGLVGAGWLVSATGLTGLLGRMLLAGVADKVNVRRYTAGVFATQTVVLALIAVWPGAATMIAASLVYGFCLGQITTLSPIVIRREFGAESFGPIYSVAATVIQLSSAFGPALYGALRDLFGGYPPVLAFAAACELAAMIILLSGRPPVAVRPPG